MKKKPGNKKTSRVLIFTVTAFCKKESVTYRCSWRIGTAVTASDEELKAVKKDLEKGYLASLKSFPEKYDFPYDGEFSIKVNVKSYPCEYIVKLDN